MGSGVGGDGCSKPSASNSCRIISRSCPNELSARAFAASSRINKSHLACAFSYSVTFSMTKGFLG